MPVHAAKQLGHPAGHIAPVAEHRIVIVPGLPEDSAKHFFLIGRYVLASLPLAAAILKRLEAPAAHFAYGHYSLHMCHSHEAMHANIGLNLWTLRNDQEFIQFCSQCKQIIYSIIVSRPVSGSIATRTKSLSPFIPPSPPLFASFASSAS